MKLMCLSLVVLVTVVTGCRSTNSKLVSAEASSIDLIPSSTPPLIPVKDFFRNPETTLFQLSPDGNQLAFLAPYENRLNLFVAPLENGRAFEKAKSKRLTSFTDRDLRSYVWKGNRTLLFSKDTAGDENFHIFGVNIQTNRVEDYTPFPKVKASIVDSLQDVSRDEILIQTNQRKPEVFDVYRLNLRTKKLRMVAENPGNVTDWFSDHLGRVRLALASDGLYTQLVYRDSELLPFTPTLRFDFRTTVRPTFFTFDNKFVYALSNFNRDKLAAVKLDPRNGQELELLFENDNFDLENLFFSRLRKVLTSASFVSWKEQHHFFDDASKNRMDRLSQKLPQQELYLISASKQEDRFTILATSDKLRANYYLYDQNSDTLSLLADNSVGLPPDWLAETRPVEYRTRDSLMVQGYLTLPKGKIPQNLPLVLNPHGGPWARDEWGFDPEVQLLANRGYAVLQVNYRGSTGYGKKFWESSFKEWGKKMQDDLSDGVLWLIKEGVIDSKKVAIYGGSYGGYATLAGLAFTPELYACGVDYVGVSNLLTFLKSIPPYWKPMLEKLYAMVGNPELETGHLRERSPVFFADRIRVPLLIAQGAQDPRVNKNESDQMVAALQKRGIQVQYLLKENEGHGFLGEENRLEFYEAMDSFLKKCLEPNQKLAP